MMLTHSVGKCRGICLTSRHPDPRDREHRDHKSARESACVSRKSPACTRDDCSRGGDRESICVLFVAQPISSPRPSTPASASAAAAGHVCLTHSMSPCLCVWMSCVCWSRYVTP